MAVSQTGPAAIWEDLLDGLNLQGSERALDFGRGRGRGAAYGSPVTASSAVSATRP